MLSVTCRLKFTTFGSFATPTSTVLSATKLIGVESSAGWFESCTWIESVSP